MKHLRRALGKISLQDHRYPGHFLHILDIIAILFSEGEELEVLLLSTELRLDRLASGDLRVRSSTMKIARSGKRVLSW